MSLRTIQRLAIASALVLGGLSAGCDDDNDGGGSDGSGDGTGDGGTGDGGTGDGSTDGDADGSTDGSADGGTGDGSDDLMCTGDTEVCTATMAGPLTLDACCDDPIYADKCGAKLDALGAALGNGLAGCFSKGQPGDGSKNCADLLDGIDGTPNSTFTVNLGAAGEVELPACCTATGDCGIVLDTLNTQLGSIEVGFGCVPLGRLTSLFGGETDGGTPDAGAGDDGPAAFPYCLPGGEDADNDAACPPDMTIALAGVSLCDALAEQGLPITENCDDTAKTPLWVCQLLNLPTITEGTVPTDVGDCLKFIPKYVAGCGVGEQGDGKCIPNVEQKFGCEDVTEVPGLPEYACGCGEGEVGTGSCIPNVANTVCGAIEVTAGPIPNLPSGACGCGDEMIAEGCIPNIPATICGAVAGCTADPFGTQGSCPDLQICVDVKPDGAPDGLGDACIPAPSP